MNRSDIFWQTYLNLEKELIEVSKYIFITDVKLSNKNGVEVVETCNTQMETFSPFLADLLVRCCVQIETISKELYYEIGGPKPRGDNTIFFDEDCLRQIDIKWQTHKKQVLVVAPFFSFNKDENRILRPLKEAHKRQGTYWEKAYQAVKHDRYSSLCAGNVRALIQAMAALYLLNIYMRKDSWVIKYQDLSKLDLSLGSTLFAVRPPIAGAIWYGNQPQVSESPYVIVYKADSYLKIENAQRAEKEALNNYILEQPELNEPDFIKYIDVVFKERDQAHRYITLEDFTRYRLNKLIPATLPFEERKKRLINSDAWQGQINQNNLARRAPKITVENIQDIIEEVARYWGWEIERTLRKEEWALFATSTAWCNVYIPE